MSSSHWHVFLAFAFLIQFAIADGADDCRVPADPDVLGLGVRLGLYFQTASTMFISLVRPEEAKDSWLPTALFFSAFFVALLYSVAHNLFPPGGIINCTWYPVLILIALYPYDFGSYSDNSRGRRAQLFLVLWISSISLNIWFWFKGLDIRNVAQCMEPRVFFFANLSALGGARILFRILCLLSGVLLMAIIVSGVLMPWRKRKARRDEESALSALPLTVKIEKPSSRQHVRSQTTLPAPVLQAPVPSTSVATASADARALSALPLTVKVEKPSATPHVVLSGVKSQTTLPAPVPQTSVPSISVATASGDAANSSTEIRPPITTNEEAERKWGGIMFFTLVLIFYIVASELQLKWNHLDGINSLNTTGQIIPLVIGTLSLLRTIFLLRGANWVEFWQTLNN
jgi:hypothetical protein